MRRKMAIIILVCQIFLVLPMLLHTKPVQERPNRIELLEGLCRVWGIAKFFHPYMAYREIDWDKALVETIPLVDSAETGEAYRAAIDHLLSALNDPVTKTIDSQIQPFPPAESSPAGSGIAQLKWIEDEKGKRIAVVTATDWQSLGKNMAAAWGGGMFSGAFSKCGSAHAIIIDLRRATPAPPPKVDVESAVVAFALREDIRRLIDKDLLLPASRSRVHSGYTPQIGQTTGGFFSGFQISEFETLATRGGPAAGKRLVILINKGSRNLAPILFGLQSTGQAVLLQEDYPDVFLEGNTYETDLPFGITVQIRTSELLGSNGNIGFEPSIKIDPERAGARDLTMERALAVARGIETVELPSRRPGSPGTRRVYENSYPEMRPPNREYRLLGLFRLWTVMNYFFPYKQHMDRSWEEVLFEFIPRFEAADSEVDYVSVVYQLLANLKDSHVGAGGKSMTAVKKQLRGNYCPGIVAQPIQGAIVITDILDKSLKQGEAIIVGENIIEIDGKTVDEVRTRVEQFRVASTEQILRLSIDPILTRGAKDSTIGLKLKRPDGTVHSIELPRKFGVSLIYQRFMASRASGLKVFTVLPEGYGYFDLRRLTTDQIAQAFEQVKETPALIMDMRGYPRGTGYEICSRLTDTQFNMAQFYRPYWTNPDPSFRTVFSFYQQIDPSTLWKYKGEIVVLIDAMAISQAEHSCLGFEGAAKGRITFIGSPTAGTNGDITNTLMPGGITVQFSGHDVRHADGRQLQRIGILPDITVERTVEGVLAGKDELLEAAIEFLKKKFK